MPEFHTPFRFATDITLADDPLDRPTVVDAHDCVVCTLFDDGVSDDEADEHMARMGALFAAAPDLLAATEDLIGQMKQRGLRFDEGAIARAEAAVAKARDPEAP